LLVSLDLRPSGFEPRSDILSTFMKFG
jgi:hypothetical protein